MKFESSLYPETNRHFRKAGKVLEWLDGEVQAWDWLQKAGVQHASQAFQKIQGAIVDASKNLRQSLAHDPEETDHINWAVNSLNRLSKFVETRDFLPSKSSIGQYANELKESDPELAATLVYVALTKRTDNLAHSRIIIEAVATLRLFERGIVSSAAEIASKQVASSKAEFATLLEQSDIEARELIDDLVQTTQNKKTAYKRSRTTLARWINGRRKRAAAEQKQFEDSTRETLTNFLTDGHEKIEKFLEFYRDEMALAEPVSYWSSKQSKHRFATVVLGAVFVLYGWFIFKCASSALSSSEFSLSRVLELFEAQPVATITVVILLITLVLIVSRIIYRLFLSQLHLWNDAAERVTMIKTYLSLASRDHAKEEHLVALTNRLFAPASDGVVKDDFGSISVIDLLANRVK